MRRARKRRHHLAPLEISLTPLIDTVLVLLITFMVAMPVMQNMLHVELPTGSANDGKKGSGDTDVSVYIDHQRQLYVNDKMIKRADLVSELEKHVGKNRNKVVYVYADKNVIWNDVARVIDDIKYLAGVEYVALPTQVA